jgi:alpha-1,2-mannosyltransferase
MTTTRTERARVGPRHIAVLGAVWAVAAAGHILYGNRHHFFDLGIYYRAVRWWAEGHDIYSYSQPDRVEGTLGFTYPPFAAVLMRPLGDLPLVGAQAIFVVLSLSALVALMWLVVAPVATRLGYPAWFGVALVLPIVSWLEPVRETFSFGQINFIVAAMIVIDLLVLVPRKSHLAGVGIGLAAAIKLTPAIFVIYLLLTRRWRPAATAMIAAAVATLAGAAMTWNGTWQFWTGLLWQTDRVGRMDRIQNQSLMGTLARLARPDQLNGVAWVILALLITGYGLWRARAAALAGDEVAGLTLTALVGCLVSPVTWTHHLVWFAPALVVLVDVVLDRRHPLRQRRWLATLAIVLYVTVAFSVVTWYDWHVLRRAVVDKGVPGFLIDNWYLLLMAALLVALPIRTPLRVSGSEPLAVPAGREVVTSEQH